MKYLKFILAAGLFILSVAAQGQGCAGAQVSTRAAYLYGRFETRMQSAPGNGVVSSFFQYNLDLNCNWPAENNEIDIEMTGNRDNSVQFTTHYPGPWSVTEIVPTPFNPHAGMHDYAFEWAPGVVRWFIDGTLAFTQDAAHVNNLMYPMRILMNLWAADAPGWVGPWDPAVLPVQSSYEFVRYYAYTPGSGNAGTNNNFTLEWTDDFNSFDADRWEPSKFGGFDGNYCTFVSNNVDTTGGQLRLLMTEPLDPTSSPVHFSVDASSLNLSPSDVIYVNGGFNGWCGFCNPMSDNDGDGIWELTLTLPAGKHEYLFTKNGWAVIGGAPLGSSCDFTPCDEYANYGVSVPHGSGPIVTETYCWAGCDSCADTDSDGMPDAADNCIEHANGPDMPDAGGHSQLDTDGDGFGNACDADLNNDNVVDFGDLPAMQQAFFSQQGDLNWNPDADMNGDGVTDFGDLPVIQSSFFGPPGPSGLVP